MGKLAVGDKAPAFALPDQEGRRVASKDYLGRKLLVFFYPEADTPGCTVQACSARDAYKVLEKKRIAVVGISPDAPDAQKAFDAKYRLGFPLLSDVRHKAAEAYGAWGEKVFFGKRSVGIIRSSFLIGEDGKLLGVWYRVSPEATIPKALGASA